MTFNPLDKNGFIFMMTTLWDKIKAIIPTKTSQLQNDSGYKTTDTTYGVVSKAANGLAPKLPNETATTKYLRQDGTWQTPPNTTYGVVTQSASGLMIAADKKKLDGIATGANKTTYTNNLAATVAGTALDATQGKALNDKGAQINVYKGDDGKLHFRDWNGADTVIPFSGNNHNYLVKDGEMVDSPIMVSASLSNLAYSSTYKALTLQTTTGSGTYGGVSGTLTLEIDVTNVNKIYYNVVSRSSYITPKVDNVATTGNMIDVSNLVGTHTIIFNCGNQSKVSGFLPNDFKSIGIYDVYYE